MSKFINETINCDDIQSIMVAVQVPSGMKIIQLSEYDKLKQDNFELHEKLFKLTADQHTLQETIRNRDEIILARDLTIIELRKENDELRARIADLEQKHIELNHKVNVLNNKITQLSSEMNILKQRDNPITIREEIVALEQHIMLEICGSKRKIRQYYGILDLIRDSTYRDDYTIFLNNYNLSDDHITLIKVLKDSGNHIRAHVV